MANTARSILSGKLQVFSQNLTSGMKPVVLSGEDDKLLRESYDRYYVPPNGEKKDPTENIAEFMVKIHPVYNKPGYWVRTKDGKLHTLSIKNIINSGSSPSYRHSILFKCLSAIRYSTSFYNYLSILKHGGVKYKLRTVDSVFHEMDTTLKVTNDMVHYDNAQHIYHFIDQHIQDELEEYHLQMSIVYID